MIEFQCLLDAIDKGAAVLHENIVIAANTAMLETTLIAGASIAVGQPLPEQFVELLEENAGEMTFGEYDVEFAVQQMPTGEQLLLLWREEMPLGRETLDGFFYRLREELSVTSVSIEGLNSSSELDRVRQMGQMKKSFYGMVHLLEQVEILRGEYPVRAVEPVDLTARCQRLQLELWELMKEIGVTVDIAPQHYNLYTKVDGELLERFVMSAVASAVFYGAKTIKFSTSRAAKRVKLVITDDHAATCEGTDLRAKLREELMGAQGKLDTATMREMVRMMGGRMLTSRGVDGRATLTFSLPAATGCGATAVYAPRTDEAQRYNKLLVQYAQFLPSKLFCQKDIE